MANAPARRRFNSSAIALHWVVLGLVVAAYTCILLRENFPKGSELREALKAWHFALGLSVLVLMLARVPLRMFVWKSPAITPEPALWEKWLAVAVHVALYGLLIAMPIAGWLILSAEGKDISFWGLQLPPLVAPSEPLAEQIQELHETGGTIGYFLIGLHAAAALFHHYVQKDDTLVRMLPGGRRGKQQPSPAVVPDKG